MLKKVTLWKVLTKNGYTTEYWSLMRLIKANKLKRVDKRLQVIKRHLRGKQPQEIAEETGYSRRWIYSLIKQYHEKGLDEFARHKYGGNHRAMSLEAEEEILGKFEEEAKSGRLVVANTIKKAFDEKRGKDTGRGYIYELLKRHNMRKVTPRPAHPKKASDEAIEASKKLTNGSGSLLPINS